MQQVESRRLRLAEAGPPPKLDPFGDEEGSYVLRCRGLSGETKLAWSKARELAGWPEAGWDWEDRKFKLSAQDLAEHQGVDSASGRRRRADLEKRGLITVHHRCGVSGAWTVTLVQPSAALDPEALGVRPGDPQKRLDVLLESADEATSESSADGLSDAPASSAQLPPGAAEVSTLPPHPSAEPLTEPPRSAAEVTTEPPRSPLTSGHQNTSVVPSLSLHIDIGQPSDHPERVSIAKDQGRGGSANTTAAAEVEPTIAELTALVGQKQAAMQRELGLTSQSVETTAALAAALVQRLPDERSRSMARERWISLIQRTVGDELLKLAPCVKVASAIVAGELKESAVQEVFAELRKHRAAGTLRSPGAYFVGSMQRVFQRLGLAWEAPQRKPRPK